MNVKNRACIRRLSIRSLWSSRRRNLIAVIAIALTALLFTSLFTVAMSMNASYETYAFRQIGGYSHGSFKELTEEQIKKITAHPNVKAVGRRTNVGYMVSGVFAKTPAEISFMDENCTKWSYAEPSVGHCPQGGKEVTMDTFALKLLGIEPELGAKITLTYLVNYGDPMEYEKTDTFTLTGWWEYDNISPVHYINISEEYASAAEAENIKKGAEPFRTDLNVMLPSSVNIRGQMEAIDRDLGYVWERTDEGELARYGVNWGYTSSQLGERIDAEAVIAIVAFLALVIFTGYLIIYNIFQISVTGDIRFYGLLKTIGVTPRQLRRIIRLQALALCIVGIPAGLLLGYGVGAALAPVILARTTLGAAATTISSSPFIFLASALFALVTVLLSCARPGRIAGRVSPVEALKYTEITKSKKKRRATRGAKVYQMAFANLGRSKSKTFLVVLSLTLSVVLLNLLVLFTGGFDVEKYLEQNTCADFIVSSTDYFRFAQNADHYLTENDIDRLRENTDQSLSGCGYTIKDANRPLCWMPEESWRMDMGQYASGEIVEATLSGKDRRGDLVAEKTQIEGIDQALFPKLSVVEGDMEPMFQGNEDAIAIAVDTDDYGHVTDLEYYPPIGSKLTITYIEEAYYIDSRTGEKCDETTPEEFLEFHIEKSHDVDYDVCAYVTVPYAMSYRYYGLGYRLVLPQEKLAADSGQTVIPMVYLFDTPDSDAEEDAENYLSDLTSDDVSGLMYESKAILRDEFSSYRNMFLLVGGLLCAIIFMVGVLNFFNAIMTGILSRQREFAVLQAVGMTSKQLKAMLIYEGMFYTISSAVMALVFSIVCDPLIAHLLEKMFWFFSAEISILPILGMIPVYALLGWLIPFAMYGQSARYSIVERLREAG